MKPRAIFLVLVPLAILLLPVTVYWIDRAASSDEIPRNVAVAGIELGGLGREDAELALQAHESQLRTTPAVFVVNGKRYRLDPDRVGLSIDERHLVDVAMQQRAADGVFDQFGAWLRSFTDPVTLDLDARVDNGAIDEQLEEWETDAIPDPAYEGSVDVVDGEVIAEYPRAGRALDRDRARVLVLDTLAAAARADTELPVVESVPTLTRTDLDAAVEEVRRIIDDPVTLRSNETGFLVTFEPEQLEAAVLVDVRDHPAAIEVSLDDQYVIAVLLPRRSEFEIPPVDAAYNIDLETDEIEIIAGRSGTRLDLAGVVASLHAAALGSGFGPFPVLDGDAPQFTTEAAEAFFANIEKVSEFGTRYNPGEPRTHNIQRMADLVDGAIVLPGETWGVNGHVGERTEAKGFVAAPAIIGGVPYCCDHPANIGGGVSQFGTTIYNAVFFGCYEDVEHSPHSLYFTRYPEGREATLGFPKPDVVFRNNTDTPVVIKTQYTDRELMVKFYGNNGGRECISETSERSDIREHEEVLIRDRPEEGTAPLLPGQRRVEQVGKNGFTVVVTRIIRLPDGSIVTEEPFRWRYNVLNEEIAVHPCELSGEAVDCPIPLPNVTGIDYGDALTALMDAGFLVARVDVAVDDEGQNGLVLSMDPPAGEITDLGATITLTVGVFSGGGAGDG